jgi:hypothetical protein
MSTGSGAPGRRFVLPALLVALVLVVAAVTVALLSSSDPSGEPAERSGKALTQEEFWGDVSSIPAARNVLTVKILNRTNGKYPDDQVFWRYNDQVHSIAEQPYFDMPANTAGRMYFHLGSPDSPYNDFIEFTVGPDVFNGNTTRVDAFGLKLAMRLRAHDGYDAQVGEDLALFAESREDTFQRFVDEVPEPFKQLGRVEAPYRIPAPRTAEIFQPGGAHSDYFAPYTSRHGIHATSAEIFGCSGPLAEDPARCAAINRHILDNPESTWLDPSTFYTEGPANYYAKFWHDHSIGGLSYGFPYDDHANQSSFISHGDPQWLLVAVGW